MSSIFWQINRICIQMTSNNFLAGTFWVTLWIPPSWILEDTSLRTKPRTWVSLTPGWRSKTSLMQQQNTLECIEIFLVNMKVSSEKDCHIFPGDITAGPILTLKKHLIYPERWTDAPSWLPGFWCHEGNPQWFPRKTRNGGIDPTVSCQCNSLWIWVIN